MVTCPISYICKTLLAMFYYPFKGFTTPLDLCLLNQIHTLLDDKWETNVKFYNHECLNM
jgi:hypothetical protein